LHKAAFLREQEELGLARLLEWEGAFLQGRQSAGELISLQEEECRE
jgi:hypothetical protein